METYGYIYETINLKNGKIYIGQHKSKNWDSNYFGSGILLNRAIKKYGIENFECNLIMWASSKEELNKLEIKYIAYYKPEYNISTGGTGGNLGEKVNKLISEGQKGRISWNKGKTNIYSEETRKKMSEAKKGKSSWNKGKIFSEETRKKMSEAKKGKISSMKGKHHSEKSRKKMSESRKGRHWIIDNETDKRKYKIFQS
jgi:group I intron endonuclease